MPRLRSMLAAAGMAYCAAVANNSLVWQPLYEPGCGGDITSVRVSPMDPARLFMCGDMLGATYSLDQGTTWLQADAVSQSFASYEMNDFTFDAVNGRVYLAALSGVYYSNASDASGAWAALHNGLPNPNCCGYNSMVQRVLVDPSNADHLLAFAGSKRHWGNLNSSILGTVYESMNAGQSWSSKSVVVPGGNVMNADWVAGSAGRSVWAAVDTHGMYRSDDGGATWSAMNSGLPAYLAIGYALVHPTEPGIAYVALCGSAGVYKTTNGGGNWSNINGGVLPSDGCFSAFGMAASAPDTLYVGCSNQTAIWKTTNGGVTWTTLTGVPAQQAYGLGFQSSFLDVDPTDPDTVYYATWVTLYATHDGGATWRDITAFAPVADPSGTIWRGTGFSGLVSTNFKWNPYAPDMAVLQAMDAGKIWTSTDNLYSWRRQSGLQEFGGGHDVTFAADGVTLYAGTGQGGWPSAFSIEGVVKSVDGGVNWVYCGHPNITGTMQGISVYTLPGNASNVWAIFQDGRLYFSSDGCATFDMLPSPNDTLYTLAAPRFRNAGSDPRTVILYAAGYGGVWNTSTGFDFALMPGAPGAWQYSSNRVYVSQADDTTVWLANGFWDQWHNGLFKWSPSSGGSGWSQFFNGDTTVYSVSDSSVTNAAGNGSCIIAMASNRNPYPEVCDATGVHISVDGGASWSQQTLGLPMRRVATITFSPDGSKLVVGLNGRGFFWADTSALLPNCAT